MSRHHAAVEGQPTFKEVLGAEPFPEYSFQIILGSGSAARLELFKIYEVPHLIRKASIDEKEIRFHAGRDTEATLLIQERPDRFSGYPVDDAAAAEEEEKEEETEIPRSEISPELLTVKLAHAKADAILAKYRDELPKDGLLVTSDSVAVKDGVVREKPESETQCRNWWKEYSKGSIEVVSSIVVTEIGTSRRAATVDRARQHFKEIPEEIIEKLLEEGDVFNCCGGFMIDVPTIIPYVGECEGEPEVITGLSMAKLRIMFDAIEAERQAARESAGEA